MNDSAPHSLAVAFIEVRSTTERLAAPLSAEDQTVQSMADVSPTKWHRAHTTWFFETFLLGDTAPFNDAFSFLFNSYYEGVGPRYLRANRGQLSRPGVDEIGRYRTHVDAQIKALLETTLTAELEDLMALGIHHEQQHQELLLMDIKHVLAQNPTDPCYAPFVSSRAEVLERSWESVEAGVTEIGARDDVAFAFDNERPRHRHFLHGCEVATTLVTNAEWLEFIDDGGYQRPDHWLSEGWQHVMAEGWVAPLYWRSESDTFTRFSLAGRLDLDPAAPVCHLSYYEADAFARWAGCRLPTEFEWEQACTQLGYTDDGRTVLTIDPEPASAPDFFGSLWQWTSSSYSPYPGFTVAPGAVGEYNGKFMVNQQVLRGSACITPPGHSRPSYRNFFPAHSRWMFSGLRLARDLP